MAKAKKTAKKTPKKAIVKAAPQELAPVMEGLFDDEGGGYEDADSDSFAIPFLQIVQQLSPQMKSSKAEYNPDAREGDFILSTSQQLFDGEEGVTFIPCAYQRRWNEWVPRNKGGGFKGSRLPEDVDLSTTTRDDKGRFVTPEGTQLMDTRMHYGLLVVDGVPQPVLLSLSSTQIKVSKNWMTGMQAQQATNPQTGKRQRLPMYAQQWLLTSVTKSNDQGDWKILKPSFDCLVTDGEVFAAGRAFKDQIMAGEVKAANPEQESEDSADDDVPF